MTTIIGLIPAFPLLSFLIIALFGNVLPKKVVAALGVGSVAVSSIITVILGIRFISSAQPGESWISVIYTWINTGGFTEDIFPY